MNVDLSTILNNINQRVFVKDVNGLYVYVNASFAEILNINPALVIGKSDHDLIWQSQADYFREDDKSVMEGKSLVNVERYQTRSNGLTKIMLTLVPYRLPNGAVSGVVGNFFDCNQHLVVETKGIFDNEKLHLEFVNESLSAAEIRICFYVLHNFPAPRIAEKTKISVSTVRYHIENIKNKMRCESKSEITEVAMRTGIAWKIFSLQHQIEDTIEDIED